jgi:hypothetical protein
MGDHWEAFLQLSVKAFLVLKKHDEDVISYIETIMAMMPRLPGHFVNVRDFVSSTLMRDKDFGQAAALMRAKLQVCV